MSCADCIHNLDCFQLILGPSTFPSSYLRDVAYDHYAPLLSVQMRAELDDDYIRLLKVSCNILMANGMIITSPLTAGVECITNWAIHRSRPAADWPHNAYCGCDCYQKTQMVQSMED